MCGSRQPGATLALVVAVVVAGCGGEDEAALPPTPTPAPIDRVVSASLAGAAEPDGGSAIATGRVVIELDSKTRRVCWTLSVEGLDEALSAHVHVGRPGEIGRVVIPLGSRFAEKGCVRVPVAAIRAVATEPAGHYVNVYTTRYIDGAIRGQLRAGS